jgi:xylan 1,4-beta-xylosidase
MVYCNARSFEGVWKDTPNYLVTTDDINGEWSDPIYLTSIGFDGSMFHDDDGRKWFLSMQMDHRNGKFFGGIIIQEYSVAKKKLIGQPRLIFEGTELGRTEGPHIYKKDGFYYLITAEGGTEYGHAASIARSDELFGPYVVHPQNPILSSRDNPEHPIQKTGHADIVQTPEGDWFIVYLMSRPLSKQGRCILGRETGIEKLNWETGQWPRIETEDRLARTEIPSLSPTSEKEQEFFQTNFSGDKLDYGWQALRIPIDDNWANLTGQSIILKGRESLSSTFKQSLIARRLKHFKAEISTEVSFKADSFQQMAGLVCYYNTYHYHYLYLSVDDNDNRVLNIISCDKHLMIEPLDNPVSIPDEGSIRLKVEYMGEKLQFYYALEDGHWQPVGNSLDSSILSDDYVRNDAVRYEAAFTGTFIGICCQDLEGQQRPAEFHNFTYKSLD